MEQLAEDVALLARRVVDAALAEVGFAGAVDLSTGALLDGSVPPEVLFRAWCLGIEAAGEVDPPPPPFAEWPAAVIAFFDGQPVQQQIWRDYFDHHRVT